MKKLFFSFIVSTILSITYIYLNSIKKTSKLTISAQAYNNEPFLHILVFSSIIMLAIIILCFFINFKLTLKLLIISLGVISLLLYNQKIIYFDFIISLLLDTYLIYKTCEYAKNKNINTVISIIGLLTPFISLFF